MRLKLPSTTDRLACRPQRRLDPVKPIALAATLLSATIGTVAFGQSGVELPAKLAGRWTVISPTKPTDIYTDHFSLTFEDPRTPGTVQGRLNWRGVNCGAKNEPIQALWDGTELKFEAILKADTNTQRSYGKCVAEPVRWVMKRKDDGSFEGQGHAPNNIVATVTASP
jgi:hypothetical protein